MTWRSINFFLAAHSTVDTFFYWFFKIKSETAQGQATGGQHRKGLSTKGTEVIRERVDRLICISLLVFFSNFLKGFFDFYLFFEGFVYFCFEFKSAEWSSPVSSKQAVHEQ